MTHLTVKSDSTNMGSVIGQGSPLTDLNKKAREGWTERSLGGDIEREAVHFVLALSLSLTLLGQDGKAYTGRGGNMS